eukprot:CAMPEP_0194117580 /NCGR_PEP_ID=MMETSP0150-20130528/31926_1 /TAXON_ID=122233 /ORGANISM="Chaetoceros debilis, Strain MM31A-1" /LENGTH=406 /DNA_ID=CAMNT_0038808665 /DNA_START=21 /DNA_END=1241 /DNA_ORIENTATION=-
MTNRPIIGDTLEKSHASWRQAIAIFLVCTTSLAAYFLDKVSFFSTDQSLLPPLEHQFLDLSKFDLSDHQYSKKSQGGYSYEEHIRRKLRDKPWTGSFSNCNSEHKTSKDVLDVDTSLHQDSGIATISCRKIHFRAPKAEIEKGGPKIVVGVLSAAAEKGPLHRDSIRSTWARDRENAVYFIVGGPWDDVKEEYEKYRDLIWLDEDEVYEGEESVLPFKTELFIDILHRYTLPHARFEYLFKTDDDSYVNLDALEKTISARRFNYWGCCTTENYKPLRSPTRKWMVTFDMYPEEFYPLYCQGAGFAMSKKFVECMSENLADFRYSPFEDVSIGLLAERCGFSVSSNFAAIKQYRTEEAGEKKQLNNAKQEEIYFLPKATMMKPKVLQHRVKTHYDMYAHYKCVQDGC